MGTTPLELPATLTPDEVRRLLWLEQLDSVYQMIAAGELAARKLLVGIIRRRPGRRRMIARQKASATGLDPRVALR